MRCVGVDLAWGTRARTGLCAVTGSGEVLGSASVVDDDDVLSWISGHDDGELVLGFDAPIVVPNATGSRRCEQAVTSVFGSFHAGAYPSNTSMAAFRDGPRAARLAHRLGASLDVPAAPRTGGRRAMEVYPHAAMVVLFGLDRVLPYKRRTGRDLPGRRASFARMTELLCSLRSADPPLDVTTSPRWAALVDGVATAVTGAALDRMEDELDAYVCAYVSLLQFSVGLGGRCAALGHPDDGLIVTPMCPPHDARLEAWRRTHV